MKYLIRVKVSKILDNRHEEVIYKDKWTIEEEEELLFLAKDNSLSRDAITAIQADSVNGH